MDQNLDDPLLPPKQPSFVTLLTNEAFRYILAIVLRAIPVYCLWNWGMAIELNLPQISMAFAFCASWLSIILFSSREIKLLTLAVANLQNNVSGITNMVSNYLMGQLIRERLGKINLPTFPKHKEEKTDEQKDDDELIDLILNPKKKSTKKSAKKTVTKNTDVDKADKNR